ncbi:hypothetical protein PHYC_00468 [Phycisphaerales bacterium]|nr:hypothetical protein PHYC_00468 [Phycisphaerales bacterium]
MASIGWEGKRARILFRDGEGKQQSIRLGECPKSDANTARMAIGHLVIAKRHGSVPHPDAVRWLADLKTCCTAAWSRMGCANQGRARRR